MQVLQSFWVRQKQVGFSVCAASLLYVSERGVPWVEHWHLQWYNLMQKATQMTCFALNRQECRQVIWQIIKQNSNIELYINTVLLIQVPHWTDLLVYGHGLQQSTSESLIRVSWIDAVGEHGEAVYSHKT